MSCCIILFPVCLFSLPDNAPTPQPPSPFYLFYTCRSCKSCKEWAECSSSY